MASGPATDPSRRSGAALAVLTVGTAGGGATGSTFRPLILIRILTGTMVPGGCEGTPATAGAAATAGAHVGVEVGGQGFEALARDDSNPPGVSCGGNGGGAPVEPAMD